jgi:tight adherence protein C
VIPAVFAFAAGFLGVAGLGLLLWSPRGPRHDRARPWPRRRRRALGGPPEPSRAAAALRVLARLGRGAARRAAPGELELRIAAAGRPGSLEPRELMAAKLAAAFVAVLPGALLGALAPGRLGVLVFVVAPAAGFLAPDLWLAGQARRRATAARRELPDLLDLMRVTVDAGASLAAALATVGARGDGPLAAEWRAVGREVELGVPLVTALAAMETRLPLAEVRALTAALDRARRHGAPLGATLATQARDARLGLRRAVQEEAARAGPKIQLVVALLLVPSVLLLVAAALLSALLASGSAGFH